MNDLRKTRKVNLKCTQCGAVMDREGSQCIRCNGMNNKTRNIISHKLHAEYLCTDCRKPLDRDGWFCKECAKKLKTRAKIRTEYRRANGLCTQCGLPADDDRSMCRHCLDMLIDRRNKLKNVWEGENKNNGNKKKRLYLMGWI